MLKVIRQAPFTRDAVAGAALVLCRSLSLGRNLFPVKVMYVPKGPLLQDWTNAQFRQQVLIDLRKFAHEKKAIFIKIDPDIRVGTGIPDSDHDLPDPLGRSLISELTSTGWCFSPDQIQYRNTVIVNLGSPEAELLQRMKQKTRYNIRLAERKGVTIRIGSTSDIPLLYRMYAETSQRDGFVIREAAYYHTVWETFIRAGFAEPLIAVIDGEPAAALIIFYFAHKAWYLYGMSLPIHRDKMPNYLLQWEALRRVKQAGCLEYDLWGAPDDFQPDDPLWGVYRFKEGLGGEVVRTVGAWDLPLRPRYYQLYTRILPHLLDWMRYRGKERTRRDASD